MAQGERILDPIRGVQSSYASKPARLSRGANELQTPVGGAPTLAPAKRV